MGVKESKAFVLRTFPLKEADKICVFFTERFGKTRAVAKGARRMNSRYGASLEPLTEVRISYFEKEQTELVSLGSCELLQSSFEDGSQPEGEAVIHYIAEMVDEFLPLGEPNERTYRLLRAVLDSIGDGMGLELVGVYFNVWILRLNGFFPNLDRCVGCGRPLRADEPVWVSIDGSPGCSTCERGGADLMLSAAVRREVRRVLTQPPGGWAQTPPAGEVVRLLDEFLRRLANSALEKDVRARRFLGRSFETVSK